MQYSPVDYHSKLYAHELILKAPRGSVHNVACRIMDAKVDLNPHQVDAALFAFRSPLSKGALLADEVGLGKTIEAGILIAQKWSEMKRKVLIVVPAHLRKQWLAEIREKFYLPAKIIEAKSFNAEVKDGGKNPFFANEILICSYEFLKAKAKYIKDVPWDLAVLDEAHRLRNVYKSKAKQSREVKEMLKGTPKLLLTATPLHNNLLELYGLVQIIDDHVFGDDKTFVEKYSALAEKGKYDALRKRLQKICTRTLRKQVLKYVKFTRRHALAHEFCPSEKEASLYDAVSTYLQRESLHALPEGQRQLMTMVLRKLLASSSVAVCACLKKLVLKLQDMLEGGKAKISAETFSDFEALYEFEGDEEDVELEPLTERKKDLIKAEINDLNSYVALAEGIQNNAKAEALLTALKTGFQQVEKFGANQKAVIFTESRKTQEFLVDYLSANGYADKVVPFSGSNNDALSDKIYKTWLKKNAGQRENSKQADMRTALVDFFENDGEIMVATEAGGEGINLQFCSFVVNYDLPWNPQRIEQRIGRCHRYGQLHDVVVLNFLNKTNEADRRVYEILSQKFRLFDGIFGASDEVLGAIESGVDFERTVAEIYQRCRTKEEIDMAFDFLQKRFELEIKQGLRDAREKLLENFDVEVAERLNIHQENTKACIDKLQATLWALTYAGLSERGAFFDEENMRFDIGKDVNHVIKRGRYSFGKNDKSAEHYRIGHPIASYLIYEAQARKLPDARLTFDYSRSGKNISAIERLESKTGTMSVRKLIIEGKDTEEHLVFSCLDSLGNVVDGDTARRFFNLEAAAYECAPIDRSGLDDLFELQKHAILEEYETRKARLISDEEEKLKNWSEDKKRALELEIISYDDLIKDAGKKSNDLAQKLKMMKTAQLLRQKQMELQRMLFRLQEAIDTDCASLIAEAHASMKQEIDVEELFTIEWKIS